MVDAAVGTAAGGTGEQRECLTCHECCCTSTSDAAMHLCKGHELPTHCPKCRRKARARRGQRPQARGRKARVAEALSWPKAKEGGLSVPSVRLSRLRFNFRTTVPTAACQEAKVGGELPTHCIRCLRRRNADTPGWCQRGARSRRGSCRKRRCLAPTESLRAPRGTRPRKGSGRERSSLAPAAAPRAPLRARHRPGIGAAGRGQVRSRVEMGGALAW